MPLRKSNQPSYIYDVTKHFTKIPHAIIRDVMPKLSPNAWKVLTVIIDKTIGWQKYSDYISYSQLRRGTGIKQDITIRMALLELQGLNQDSTTCGLPLILSQEYGGSTRGLKYRLNLELQVDADDVQEHNGFVQSRHSTRTSAKRRVAMTSNVTECTERVEQKVQSELHNPLCNLQTQKEDFKEREERKESSLPCTGEEDNSLPSSKVPFDSKGKDSRAAAPSTTDNMTKYQRYYAEWMDRNRELYEAYLKGTRAQIEDEIDRLAMEYAENQIREEPKRKPEAPFCRLGEIALPPRTQRMIDLHSQSGPHRS